MQLDIIKLTSKDPTTPTSSMARMTKKTQLVGMELALTLLVLFMNVSLCFCVCMKHDKNFYPCFVFNLIVDVH